MTTRRTFLKTTTAATIASSAPQFLLGKKSENKHPVIGEGEFQYECHHHWGTLPEGHEYGGASHGVAVDSQGLIYITHHGKPGSIRITLLDKNNNVITHLGDDPAWREQVLAKGKGVVAMRTTPERCPAGKFVHPHDACFDADGNIYVVEWVVGGRVTKLRKVS